MIDYANFFLVLVIGIPSLLIVGGFVGYIIGVRCERDHRIERELFGHNIRAFCPAANDIHECRETTSGRESQDRKTCVRCYRNERT